MTKSEMKRLQLRVGLRQTIGADLADLLMDHLSGSDRDLPKLVSLLILRVNELERRAENPSVPTGVLVLAIVTLSTVMVGLLVQIALSVG
ncbi:MAG: hypothetical protein ACO36A_10125 [Ilumatobacteraceae bacterium]